MDEKRFLLSDLYDAWPALSIGERVEGFGLLERRDAEDFFLQLSARDRAQLRRTDCAPWSVAVKIETKPLVECSFECLCQNWES